MVGLIYAHNQSSMHLRPTDRVITLFCPYNRRIIAQIVLMWSQAIKSRFWNRANCFTVISYTSSLK